MISFSTLLYLLIGCFAGLLAGLLGIGGGLVVVPSLYFTFYFFGFPADQCLILAIGTSLGAMVFTSCASFVSHHLKKGVDWQLLLFLLPGCILGSFLGALIPYLLSGKALEYVFGIGMCLISLYFLLPEKKQKDTTLIPTSYPLHFFAGLLVGICSTTLGIGGGIFTVPYLTLIRTPMRTAIGTSAALGFPIALIGAISFLYLGSNQTIVPGSLGYVYLPAFFFIAISSSLCAPLGAKLAYVLPIHALRKMFGVLLMFVGILVMLR